MLLIFSGIDTSFLPLHTTCERVDGKTFQRLFQSGIDVNLCDENGCSPLYKSCLIGDASMVELFLSSHADINCCNEDGFTSL